MEGKRETAPVLTPTRPCSSGDERRKESREGLVRGAEGRRENEEDEEMGEGPSGFMRRKRENAAFG